MSEQGLIVLETGEVLSFQQIAEAAVERGAPECLRVLTRIRELERELREAKSLLTDELSLEFSRQGKKTLEFNGVKAELRGGTEIVWDIETLEQLRDLGLPEERMDELVKAEVTYKVNTAVAKQLAAANSDYAAVIASAKTEIPKAQYVSIKSG